MKQRRQPVSGTDQQPSELKSVQATPLLDWLIAKPLQLQPQKKTQSLMLIVKDPSCNKFVNLRQAYLCNLCDRHPRAHNSWHQTIIPAKCWTLPTTHTTRIIQSSRIHKEKLSSCILKLTETEHHQTTTSLHWLTFYHICPLFVARKEPCRLHHSTPGNRYVTKIQMVLGVK